MIRHHLLRGSVLLIALATGLRIVAAPPDIKGASKSTTAVKVAPVRQLEIQFDEAEEDETHSIGIYTNAIITDGDTTVRCAKAILNRKDRTVSVRGNVIISNPQADVSGDSGTVNYAPRVKSATLNGKVSMIIKPKKTPDKQKPTASESTDSAALRSYPLDIHCDKIVYQYSKEKKHALLTGDFHMIQKLPDKTRTLTADYAEWFGLKDMIILYPPVHVQDDKGFQGDTDEQVTILTGEGKDTIKLGKGKAVIPIKEDENPLSNSSGK